MFNLLIVRCVILLGFGASVSRGQSGFQRTILYVYAPTFVGENLFLRGGISQSVRPNCVTTPSQDPCAIAIRHRVLPTDTGSAYRSWSSGDLYLDWNGAEPGQGSFQGTAASGTPLMWTTSKTPGTGDPTVEADGHGYSAYNRLGDHFWMLDVDMNCSQTENGWFEFKTYKTPTVGWEQNIAQYRLCAGLPSTPRPYSSINHLAQCGKLNVFYNNENDCNVYDVPPSTDLNVPNTCGQRKMFADSSGSFRNDASRIVNGVPSSLGRWPWQGVLQYGTSIGGCGAVLIHSLWAVTAAHCVRGTNPSTLLVRVGEQNLDAVQGTEQAIRARNIFIHPRYGQPPTSGEVDGDNDIALVELLTPVDLVDNYIVNPGCLPRGYQLDAFVGNNNCFATGFGDSKGTSDPYRLNEIRVPVYSHSNCVATWGSDNISVRQVCMGTSTESACGGDSGGPLVCYQDGKWNLVGITSWGASGCQGRPSVYTRISEFISWIDSTTGGVVPLL